MKHCRLALPVAARCWPPVALSLLLACASRSGDATLLLDSTLLRESLEVVAVPVDPLSLRPRLSAPALPASLADTVAVAVALRDSAERLDAAFQRERLVLNVEARLLQALPPPERRSASYARRYASFSSRLQPAQMMRVQRDAVQSRADRLLTAIEAAGGVRDQRSTDSSAHAALLAAGDGRRQTIVVPAASLVRIPLASGEWWIGVGSPGRMPAQFQHVQLAGNADTVRIPSP